ncbi:MAG: PGPGW domain-containing protein [Planctomycetota bacterium]|jgi:hypothetical protein
MPEWIGDHKVLLGWLATSSVVTFIGTLIVIPILVVRIPENYFMERHHHRLPWWDRHPVLRVACVILKNAAGWLFIAAGIAMLVLPGQGVMTIVVGLMLSDFPGKFRLERWLVSRRLLIRAMNWTRSRASRPPLQVPEPRSATTGR